MFKFRLQTVLEYRTVVEERMLRRFSETARRLDEEKSRLQLLEREKSDLIGMMKGVRENAMPAGDIKMLAGYIGALQAREKGQRAAIQEVSLELEGKRKELLESVRKRKIMEKLREKNLAEYQHSLAEDERRMMDEMAATRFDGAKS